MRIRTLLVVVALLVPLAALAQNDEAGTKDHPDVPRFPGYSIRAATQRGLASFDFTLPREKTVTKEGRHYRVEYRLKDGVQQPASIEVLRNYQNAFATRRGTTHYSSDDGVGGETTLSMPLGKAERWMFVRVSPGAYELDIIETKAMRQRSEVSAREMLAALKKKGSIALYGILFDTGTDSITPESEPLLGEIVSLLKSHARLKLSIEGHTDSRGQSEFNRLLSQRRVDSVKRHLVKKGIKGTRLATKGWGETKPVADNRTAAGRAKNRRVELVKK